MNPSAIDAAHPDGLVADAVARLRQERFPLRRLGADDAGAGAIAGEHLLDRGGADVAHELLREDVGGDGGFVQGRVELRERVGVERPVAVVGLGSYLKGVQRDKILGGLLSRRGCRRGGGGGLGAEREREDEGAEQEGESGGRHGRGGGTGRGGDWKTGKIGRLWRGVE